MSDLVFFILAAIVMKLCNFNPPNPLDPGVLWGWMKLVAGLGFLGLILNVLGA